MFRKPREYATSDTPSKPSAGRPPTPPDGRGTDSIRLRTAMASRSSVTKPLTPRLNTKSNIRNSGSQATKKPFSAKTPIKPNGSILNFFKKVETVDDGGLFIPEGRHAFTATKKNSDITSPALEEPNFTIIEDDLYSATDDTERYNESRLAAKKRKTGDSFADTGLQILSHRGTVLTTGTAATCNLSLSDADSGTNPQRRRIGAFLDDSDSENDEVLLDGDTQGQPIENDAVEAEVVDVDQSAKEEQLIKGGLTMQKSLDQGDIFEKENIQAVSWDPTYLPVTRECIPSLSREETSGGDYGAFDDMDEYPDIDDEFADGEELMERKWMEEQERHENGDAGEKNDSALRVNFDPQAPDQMLDEDSISECPICELDLTGIIADQIARHVNACLDGSPSRPTIKSECIESKPKPEQGSNRFSRASIARSGQPNPFQLGDANPSTSSAFSKLMSSKAEDAAWANAAAAENAARGKPAYKRVCPFYKIMPGLYICVDAFRYGSVQGCNAYFLSHFHSDHYIGLSSTWCHGPIYCSKVTGNLVKQQLRVDPKWVVTLDFDAKTEVPNTQGVIVTMIPANHCPGSSLFLFEKVVGKGPNPKVHRILHCGDFRACSAHVQHPQLMPDIVDSITGKTKQQKIDVCYLDTTYLNPRYSFPPQDDVIQSCADMCVSLSKEKGEHIGAWGVGKTHAAASMAKFVDVNVNPEDEVTQADPSKSRGKLLVICGTYSIGKENICLGIARALDCKIWAPPAKQKICAALEDPELTSRMTTDPREAQIHMQSLMEIRAETLQDYLNGLKPYFSRIVGFRPSGWNYRPPTSRLVDSPSVSAVLTSDNWRSRYTMADLQPQRGSTREAACFGVPYSEHSSFRELTIFCCALRIEKVVPTVNVGSAASRAKMKMWIDRWLLERRKKGVIRFGEATGMVKW